MTTALEPVLSVRQVLGLERVLAGEPEVVAGAGQLDRPVRWVRVAEALVLHRMLGGSAHSWEAESAQSPQAFAERELDGLLCGDPHAEQELLPVPRTYLATGRDKSQTAQLHHVSRPALYRRLEAIETRLGVDLDDDFYGTSYFVDPPAQFVGEVASDKETELVVRDLDLARLREVRDRWQFFGDRRPDASGPITAP